MRATKPEVRLDAVFKIFMVALFVLVLRSAQLQLLDGARYAAESVASRTEEVVLPARRGAILDRWGAPLAVSQEVYHVQVTPSEFADSTATARLLHEALGLSRNRIDRELRKRYGYFGGPFTSRQISSVRHLRGVYVEPELVRFRPSADLATAIVGRPSGDGIVAGGIERYFDTLLTGTPGRSVVLQDQLNRSYESPARRDALPVPGHDINLTIDLDLQELVERSLADQIEKFEADEGEIVILAPQTGEVLALAARKRNGEMTAAPFTTPFEPGSTAKLFAAAALLTDSLIGPMDSVWGENGKYTTPHRTIQDEHDEGWMKLRDVIRRSSNIGIAKLSQRLQRPQQYLMLRRFGLGVPTGIEYPSESYGDVKRPESWSATSSASLAMGYELSVTTLQLAQAFSTFANDGVMMQPTLVSRITNASGDVVYEHEPRPVRRVLAADHAATLRAMMRDVVYAEGTGRAAALTTYEVAGKTGTARKAVDGKYVPGSHIATFVSLFPAEHPQLVLVVKLDNPIGSYAAASAVPMTRDLLQELLAGRSQVLNPEALVMDPPPHTPEANVAGAVPFLIELPYEGTTASERSETVPDLRGVPIRRAALELHSLGLRVQVEGWGLVQRTIPAAGAVLESGSTVRVVLSAETGGGV